MTVTPFLVRYGMHRAASSIRDRAAAAADVPAAKDDARWTVPAGGMLPIATPSLLAWPW